MINVTQVENPADSSTNDANEPTPIQQINKNISSSKLQNNNNRKESCKLEINGKNKKQITKWKKKRYIPIYIYIYIYR